MSGYVFGIGANAGRAEFRSTDYAGRPVDAANELPTARSERIWQLQDRWTERQLPSADPVDVLNEWLAASPDNRMSAFARSLAEHPERLPDAESEPGPGEEPQPGGLLERMAAQMQDRMEQARRHGYR